MSKATNSAGAALTVLTLAFFGFVLAVAGYGFASYLIASGFGHDLSFWQAVRVGTGVTIAAVFLSNSVTK